jgi:HD-GYP domain-containing protein (c-di-GMP phosphodiesterase class II)
MTVNQPPGDFLIYACRQLQEVLGLRWIALQLTDEEPRLEDLAGRVFTSGDPGCDPLMLDRIGKILMLRQGKGRHPLIFSDTSVANIPHLAQLAHQLLAVSLVHNERHLGIIFGADKLDYTTIGDADAKLCSAFGYSLTIFLENKMLYSDMQAMFMGTLHALTNSIDAKDSYTFGHSERVALLTKQLAVASGLDDRTVERVHISALIHDIGKIGIPESILCKCGPLTEQEFNVVKTHPLIGARILGNMRQMRDLVPGVLYHHERWDGRGYPYQLTAQEIPLFGRLISLADACDAMSSNRSYRGAMPLDRVLGEVRRNAGTQFDPQLAALFLKLDFSSFVEMIEQHSQRESKKTA